MKNKQQNSNENVENLSPSQKTFLKALEQTMGNISGASNATGIARQTHYRWLEENSEYSNAFDMVGEKNIDFVESKLMDGINEGKERLIMYYLDSKAKKRGYGRNLTISGNEDNPLFVKQSTSEEIETIRQKLKERFSNE